MTQKPMLRVKVGAVSCSRCAYPRTTGWLERGPTVTLRYRGDSIQTRSAEWVPTNWAY